MKRLGEADIRLGTVGETKAEADRKAGIKLVIIVGTGARLETTLEQTSSIWFDLRTGSIVGLWPVLILDVKLVCKGTKSESSTWESR